MGRKRRKRFSEMDIYVSVRRGHLALGWGCDLVQITPGDARTLATYLIAAAQQVDPEYDPDSDMDRPDSLESQLTSEVENVMETSGIGPGNVDVEWEIRSAAPASSPAAPQQPGCLSQGPAAPLRSSAPLGGCGRLAEDLGSVQGTLSEILGSPPDQGEPGGSPVAFEGPVRGFKGVPHYETLLTGLAAHPTDPGKILISGRPISLGHANNYIDAMRRLIDIQAFKPPGAVKEPRTGQEKAGAD